MGRLIDADVLVDTISKKYSTDGTVNVLNILCMITDQPEREPWQWVPCEDRLPECEQEVLICTARKTFVHKPSGLEWYFEGVVTPAIYEDGTMLEVNSMWHWEDIDWAGWDEEEDCGIIPEGWWENRHFNPEGEYNCPVDQKVLAWMPLPEPHKVKT